jgi:hypothetical protein
VLKLFAGKNSIYTTAKKDATNASIATSIFLVNGYLLLFNSILALSYHLSLN